MAFGPVVSMVRKERLPSWAAGLGAIVAFPVVTVGVDAAIWFVGAAVLWPIVKSIPLAVRGDVSPTTTAVFELVAVFAAVVFGVAVPVVVGLRAARRFYHSLRWRLVDDPDWRYCVRCAYDLMGNTSGVCPECGAAAISDAERASVKNERSWLEDTEGDRA